MINVKKKYIWHDIKGGESALGDKSRETSDLVLITIIIYIYSLAKPAKQCVNAHAHGVWW